MKRRTLVLAAAAVLVAVVAIGVAATSGAKQATAAGPQEPQVSTAQVERTTLSATVPQDGTLTYGAG